ncbi:collagen alpha-1(X) chain-like [Penaeus monodon]|uniref:collagen alpha-1(X) chain-like n=1 Tax=Penaeus monodon TaxID=6687 RepID=UPI0018A6F28A|nr:collagen alpha-1(X) chain-like [Penaeus monodon]
MEKPPARIGAQDCLLPRKPPGVSPAPGRARVSSPPAPGPRRMRASPAPGRAGCPPQGSGGHQPSERLLPRTARGENGGCGMPPERKVGMGLVGKGKLEELPPARGMPGELPARGHEEEPPAEDMRRSAC